MHGAPLWARALTVAAGPVFNFILSILVFAAFRPSPAAPWTSPAWGQVALPADIAQFQAGDLILSMEGQPVTAFSDLFDIAADLTPAPTVAYTVERDGQTQQIEAAFPLVPLVQSVAPQSAAIAAGLRQGDLIRAVNGEAIFAFRQLREAVDAADGAADPDRCGAGEELK